MSRSRVALAVAGVSAVAALMQGTAVTPVAAVTPADTSATWTITTVAGGVGGPGPATKVALNYPCGVAFAGGHMLVSDGFVQKVNARTGLLTTPAGAVRTASRTRGEQVPLGDGGPAKLAATSACGASIDKAGNLVVADHLDRRVRVVAAGTGTFYGQRMTAGDIYTIAGNGSAGAGISGNGGPAVKATLSDPRDVKIDKAGNLLVADSGDLADKVPAEVQVIAAGTGTFYGQRMTAGDIYKIAGSATSLRVTGNRGPAVSAGLGASIGEIGQDAAGNVVLAETSGNTIRVIAASNGTFYGQAMTAGHIYTIAGNGSKGFSGDGGLATRAQLRGPAGVAVDGAGNLVIADSHNNRVRVVAAGTGTFYGHAMTAHDIYTVAGCGSGCNLGDGGPALAARIILPDGIAVDGAGNLLVSEQGLGVVSTDRRVRLVAASDGTFYGQAMTAGHIYTVAGDGTRGYSGDGGLAIRAVMMTTESRLVLDKAGNLLVAAGENNRIRVVATRSGTFYGQRMTVGHIYTVVGGGHFPFGGDGGLATKAGMNFPDGLAIDPAGNLVIADEGNNRIRVVAATTGTFYGQPMTARHIYTVAGDGKAGYSGDGGPATKAELRVASGVTVDGHGNLVIADEGNNRVRVVAATTGTFYGQAMTAGHIYTVAGDGKAGYSGNGSPAVKAELFAPTGVAVNALGDLLVADRYRVQMISG